MRVLERYCAWKTDLRGWESWVTKAGEVTSAPHRELLKGPAWAAVSLRPLRKRELPQNWLLESDLWSGART